jgi:preprotein translocase subunit SecA
LPDPAELTAEHHEVQAYAHATQAATGPGGSGADAGPGAPMRREAPKVGRNDPCPCGSGKKFKQCCGR